MDDDNTSKDQTETKRLIHPSQFQPSSKTSDLEMPTEPFQATSSSRDEGAPSSPETPPATEPQLDNENHDDTLFSSPKSHHSTDPTDLIPLQPFDWPSLESRFTKCMEEKTQEEEDVRQELGELMNFYQVWAETPTVKEDERCTKRLRTRVAYVQNREVQLDDKRDHHIKVVTAFQNALALLG